ncbi:hypothetical protein CMU71_14905 [Elizabethkingia anophelis]|nr:hypothetical protein [Elizabethkingia anophelis]MDV3774012.1 hypothetical protein [Elizabethkingia anophelis]
MEKGYTKRKCNNCNKEYLADNRNLKRGWGLCCSKSCAAKRREKSKPGYNPKRVEYNNDRRENWNKQRNDELELGWFERIRLDEINASDMYK